MKKLLVATSALLAGAGMAAAQSGNLVIAANTSDAAPKAAFEAAVAEFSAMYPDINVEYNITEHEAYKTAIRNFLVADTGPDLGFWFAGNRMAGFVENGLFMDISDVWADNGLADVMASTMPSITFDGAQYAVPYSFYQWGVYYRPDVYEAAGVSVPSTYGELLAACEAMASQGKSLFTIGTKYKWTSGGWFDYVNMRTNGLAFHTDLMLGKISYTDDRVTETFNNFADAVNAGCFNEGHQNLSWQEGQAPLINGDAGSYLIGNFLVPNVPAETKDALDFYQFPAIEGKDFALGEDAPTDLMFVPSNAQNVENAKLFLGFLSSKENLDTINGALGQLSPRSDATEPSDRFQAAGVAMLAKSQTAQFFDRDNSPEAAGPMMELLVEFMLDPSSQADIQEELEEIRENVYGAL